LKILGAGEHEKNLKKFVEDLHATHLVEFLGRLGDDELEEMVGRSAGFVFPGISEEFGIVLVEAMAAGKPVIAFESAGSKDIILNGKTGILVKDFSVDAFAEALKQAKKKKFDPEVCRRRAKKFSIENFKKGILNNVRECLCE